MLCDHPDLENIRTEVHSPSNKLVTSEITLNKFGGHGRFTPIEPGVHDVCWNGLSYTFDDLLVFFSCSQLRIFYKNVLAAKPLKIKVHPDLTNVIFSGIEPCSVGSLVEVVVRIQCSFCYLY